MKNKKTKALLTSLIVSLIILVIAVVGTLVFDYYVDSIQFDTLGLVGGHVLGFLLIFAIVYKFESSDDNKEETFQDHNIY